ncbi:GlcG/HbpS family heme-binding protein [Nocardia sp. NBC_00403]|uniref:GlcG/HbpS family heme-binding protein n=1 Tax=Nocardia sp. NBC_00403 TaxID=2975990 RepID=UPI002E2247F4
MDIHKKTGKRAGALVGGTLVAAGAIGVWAGGSQDAGPAAQPALASKVEPADLRQTNHLTVAAATEAAQAALAAASRENQRVSVAIVDRDGNTIVLLRGDGAGPQSYEAAERKAFTAVSWNAPTSQLAGRLDKAPHLADIPGTLFLGGGVPVATDGAPIAGIGVAGAPSGDLDEKFARTGVAALGD